MTIDNNGDVTVFATTDIKLVANVLESAGIKDIKLVKKRRNIKINKKLNTAQLKRVRYYLQKKITRYTPNYEFVNMPQIIRGFKGNLLSGEHLRYLG
jgi:hypothetical protein